MTCRLMQNGLHQGMQLDVKPLQWLTPSAQATLLTADDRRWREHLRQYKRVHDATVRHPRLHRLHVAHQMRVLEQGAPCPSATWHANAVQTGMHKGKQTVRECRGCRECCMCGCMALRSVHGQPELLMNASCQGHRRHARQAQTLQGRRPWGYSSRAHTLPYREHERHGKGDYLELLYTCI